MKDLLKKIVEALRALKVVPEEKMAEVETALSNIKIEEPAPGIDTAKITDPAIKQLVEGLQAQINASSQQYKTLLDTLAAERTDREKAIETQKNQLKAERDAKIKAAVDKAIKEGKYPEAKRESLMKSANADLEAFEDMVKDLPVNKHFKSEEKNQSGEGGKEEGKSGEYKPLSPIETGNPKILSKVMEFGRVSE